MAPMTASSMAPLASPLIKPVTSSWVNAMYGMGVMRTGKGQEGGFLEFLALPLIIKTMSGKLFIKAGTEYNIMDQMDKKF